MMTVLTLLVAHSISEKVSCVYLDTGFIPFFLQFRDDFRENKCDWFAEGWHDWSEWKLTRISMFEWNEMMVIEIHQPAVMC